MKTRRRVTILQHRLLHYRLALFDELRTRCQASDIELRVVHGQPSPVEAIRNDTGTLPWADAVHNLFSRVGGVDLLWQPLPEDLLCSDLLVVMQENRILSNYPLLLNRRLGGPKVAYWGHGKNFQSRHQTGLRERWKSRLINQVDWWFAYTEMTRDIVREAGFPDGRITVLNNAIDNEGFKRELAAVQPDELRDLRARLELEEGAPLGLFCGSMYADKRLDFLFEAASLIHQRVPSFRLALIGDGPEASRLPAVLEEKPWVHWLGQQRGSAKATAFRLASMTLNPGLVGLHVLDSFCAGLPMLTTDDAPHSPELAYLQNGHTGYILPNQPELFAEQAIKILAQPEIMASLNTACLEASIQITLANMVDRFHAGICSALRSSRRQIHLSDYQ